MQLSTETFKVQFDRFKAAVRAASNGQPFVSFNQGLPNEWEGSKTALRSKALEILSPERWDRDQVGSGAILEAAISAIEIPEPNRNFLVRWQNQYGHMNRSHHALIEARLDGGARRSIESWLFDFYHGQIDDEAAFEEFRRLAGSRYDLVAYLFFLRDMDRFMPIGTKTFDHAFKRLGIDLVTAQRCSWENYRLYNSALAAVRDALEQEGVHHPRLVDAHSFCWMLVWVEHELLAPADRDTQSPSTKSSKGRTLGTRESLIWEMVRRAEAAARASGHVVETVKKIKQFNMDQYAMKEYVAQIMKQQGDKCSLTGIPFPLQAEQPDPNLLPSLDRIDSNGHYEEGNLQVVCRFINFWKGSEDNEKFRQLLALVRGDVE